MRRFSLSFPLEGGRITDEASRLPVTVKLKRGIFRWNHRPSGHPIYCVISRKLAAPEYSAQRLFCLGVYGRSQDGMEDLHRLGYVKKPTTGRSIQRGSATVQ
jgi:hypothetical protein